MSASPVTRSTAMGRQWAPRVDPPRLSFTDVTVAPSTSYTYAVDAFDGAGNHSAQSAPGSGHYNCSVLEFQAVQAGVTSTSTRLSSTTIVLSNPVRTGDLLVGWFGQYDASGQVTVSDNVNGNLCL